VLEPDQDGYALVVGCDGEARRDTANRLRKMGLPVVATSMDELDALPEVAAPRLVVLEGRSAEDRRHHQAQLRRHPRLGQVALLVLGEESDALSLTLAIGHGASAYLAKPVTDDVLACVVDKLASPSESSPALEQRRHPRRPYLVPVEVEAWGGHGRATAWLLDASATGCRIETATAMNPGQAVCVWLPLAEATAHQPLTGETRWVRSDRAGLALAGIRFGKRAAFMAGLALGIEPSREDN
jgi:CheY-like chemotaxis protein